MLKYFLEEIVKRDSAFTMAQRNTISTMVLRSALVYVFVGLLWVFFSHKILTAFSAKAAAIAPLQIYHNLFFIIATAALLYIFFVRRLCQWEQRMNRRTQATPLLHEREIHYRILAENISDVIWVYDFEDNRFTYISPSITRLRGFTVEEALKEKVEDSLTPESFQYISALLPERLAEFRRGVTKFYIDEMEQPHKNGSIVSVEITSRFGINEANGHLEVYGDSRNIGERKLAEQSLRENERLLKESQKVANLGHYVLDLRAGKWTSSEVLDAIFGIDKSFPTTIDGWLTLIHPEEQEIMQTYFSDQVIKNKQPFDKEYRIIRVHDKNVRWVHGLGQLKFDSSGNPVEMFGIIQDITERKNAEQTLYLMQERLQMVLENSDDIFLMQDSEGMYLHYIGPPHYGITTEQMLGKFPNEMFDNETASAILKRHRHVISSGENCVEDEYFIFGGEVQWFNTQVSPIRDKQGHIIGTVTISHNITQRKLAESRLQASEEKFRSYIEVSPVAVFVLNKEGKYVERNRAAIDLLGYAEEEIKEMSVFDVLHEDDIEKGKKAFCKVKETGYDEGEFRLKKCSGELVWILMRGVKLNEDRFIAYCQDITHKKKQEEGQLRLQKIEAIGTLSGGIAHDFNNILLAINGNTKIALAAIPHSHPARESLLEISKASNRATVLVKQILTFSRPQDEKKEIIQPQPVVKEALKFIRSAIPPMIKIQSEFENDLPPICADVAHLHQVIVNLVTNSAHAIGSAKGEIQVRLEKISVDAELARQIENLSKGNYVRLSIIDDGCGMTDEVLSRIFDPFFTTKPIGEGTGLGLSVVQKIIKNHNGAISVQSIPDEGTVFYLYFPVAQAEETTAPQPEAIQQSSTNHQRIMFVDDDESLVYLMTRVMEYNGYVVSGFVDCVEALNEFRKNPQQYDAVVTDLAMPAMSGFEFASEIQAVRNGIPIIMTSGLFNAEHYEQAKELGIRKLILKPDTVDELGVALAQIFQDDEGKY